MAGTSPQDPPPQDETVRPEEQDIAALMNDLKAACNTRQQAGINNAITAIDLCMRGLKAKIQILENMALEDALTGVFNRHGFFDEIHKELARCQRHPERGLCLIMVDLDDFKAINDTLGHPAGDACLKLAATTLRASVREGDTVARLGGDEFALLMGDISNMDILQRTTEIRDRLNGSFMPWQDSTIHIHGSVGFSIYQDGDSEKELIHRADRSLYQQKKLKEYQSS